MGKENKNSRVRFDEIKDSAKEFGKLSFKKYKKKNADDFDRKKDLMRSYQSALAAELPNTLYFLVNYAHIPENQKLRDKVYETMFDKHVIKAINDELDDYGDIENINLFPIVGYEMIRQVAIADAERKKEDPNAEPSDLTGLTDLIKKINKKKLKKLVKEGIDESVAFDVTCIIPFADILSEKSSMYRLKMLFTVLYEHAKTKKIDFEKLIKILVGKDQYQKVIAYSILERKDKYVNFNDSQKELFNAITVWTFNQLEEMDIDLINAILSRYVDIRKREKEQGKDSARRYFIGTLPESDYPQIHKIMTKLKEVKPGCEEFF